jgi:hypothetical protein
MIRAGLQHKDPAGREGCCRLLDHLVDTDSMSQLIAMADDPDARVRTAAFHALACDRCKGGTCAAGAGQVLGPAAAPGRRPRPACPRGLYGARRRGYGAGVVGSAAGAIVAGVHGFPVVSTSVVGWEQAMREIAVRASAACRREAGNGRV